MLLSQAAEWLYQINPTLVEIPPRVTADTDDNDDDDVVCYNMGVDDGNNNTDGVILCKELQYSHATCVGSWMLSPEQHIIEGVIMTLVAILILRKWTTPKLVQQQRQQQEVNTDKKFIQHPKGARFLSLFCFMTILLYKYYGYPNRLYYIVMPCNMQWLLSFIQCYLIPEYWQNMQYTILQLRITYIMSVIIALVTPETDDCLLPGEYMFYWLNHILLLWFPFAYIANGSVSTTLIVPTNSSSSSSTTCTSSSSTTTIWKYNILWWSFSCCIMTIFYFIPVTFLAIYSGLNLNFMLHPPQNHFLLKEKAYRLISVCLLAILFGISRYFVYSIEKAYLLLVVRRRKGNNNKKANNNKSKKES